jgi:hypothetical protein
MKTLYSQVYTSTRASCISDDQTFAMKDIYIKNGTAYHYDIIKQGDFLCLDLGKGGRFPLPGILNLELHREKDVTLNKETRAAEHYVFNPGSPVAVCSPEFAAIFPDLKDAPNTVVIPVPAPAVAPAREERSESLPTVGEILKRKGCNAHTIERVCDLSHNPAPVEKVRFATGKQTFYIKCLTGADIRKYVYRWNLTTKRASWLITAALRLKAA